MVVKAFEHVCYVEHVWLQGEPMAPNQALCDVPGRSAFRIALYVNWRVPVHAEPRCWKNALECPNYRVDGVGKIAIKAHANVGRDSEFASQVLGIVTGATPLQPLGLAGLEIKYDLHRFAAVRMPGVVEAGISQALNARAL